MIRKTKDRVYHMLSLDFVRDIFTLQIGSFFNMGFAFIASVIYARVLGPDNYGDYALIFAFAGLVGLFLDWGVSYATLTLLAEAYTRGDRQEIKDILTYFLKLSFITYAVVGTAALILSPFLAGLIYHRPEIGNLARFIVFATFIQIFFSLLTTLLQVMRKIKYLTIIENINRFFLSFFPVILVFLGFGLLGIVLGNLFTAIGFMIFSFWMYHVFSVRNQLVPPLQELIKNFKQVKITRYFKFGFLVAIDKNINGLYSLLPIIILGRLASSQQVANLKIALSYLALQSIFLGPISRLLQVQLPKAKVAGVKDLRSNFYKSAGYTGVAFIGLTLIFLFFAPPLIKIFYGEKFLLSINLVYALSLSVIFSGFTIGLGPLYRTINKNANSIMINICGLISGFVILFSVLRFISPLKSVVVLLIYWSFYTLIAHLTYLSVALKKLK